jgi:hypothetical protein
MADLLSQLDPAVTPAAAAAALAPKGATLAPEGAALAPEGAALAPEGAALAPEGAALAPEGAAAAAAATVPDSIYENDAALAPEGAAAAVAAAAATVPDSIYGNDAALAPEGVAAAAAAAGAEAEAAEAEAEAEAAEAEAEAEAEAAEAEAAVAGAEAEAEAEKKGGLTVLNIAGLTLYMDSSPEAVQQRYADPTRGYIDTDKNVLKAIGVLDKKGEMYSDFQGWLPPLLPRFMDSLAECNTTAKLILSAECSETYWVLQGILQRIRNMEEVKKEQLARLGYGDEVLDGVAGRAAQFMSQLQSKQ